MGALDKYVDVSITLIVSSLCVGGALFLGVLLSRATGAPPVLVLAGAVVAGGVVGLVLRMRADRDRA